MTRTWIAILLAGRLWQQAAAPPVPADGQAEIRGRVVSAATGAPLAGADVRVVPASPGRVRSFKTGDDGRFVAPGLPAGAYRVSVSFAGYVPKAFGSATEAAAPITLVERDRLDRGDLALIRGMSITGVVLDPSGRPLANARVQVLRAVYSTPGARRLLGAGGAQSSESGEYRLSGLVAGTYYVSAVTAGGVAPTFYPGVVDSAAATPVVVPVGVDASGIDVRLLDTVAVSVGGRVVNTRGEPAAGQMVWLTPARPDAGAINSVSLTSEVAKDGSFTVKNVPPGAYRLESIATARLEALARSGSSQDGSGQFESGALSVTVADVDVTDLVVQTAEPVSLDGVVTLDGRAVTAELASRLSLQLLPRVPTNGPSDVIRTAGGSVTRDGTFRIPLSPGGVRLRPFGLPPGTFLKRVTIRGQDVTDEGFDVPAGGLTGVEVQLTTTVTTVTGRVANDHGQPLAGVAVIVFSADARHWTEPSTRRIKGVRAGADGAFTLTDLPPGSYLAIAQADLEDGEWASPANLNRLRLHAKALTLRDGERLTLTLILQ